MAALRPRSERRRPRRGSLERPVIGRLYRGTWLLVALPLLLAALSVERPVPLPPPSLPATFDGAAALRSAKELATRHPNRFPGSPGARQAARWVAAQLAAHGFSVRRDRFAASIPGHGTVQLQNVSAVALGRSPQAIVVVAHRDNSGTGPGANDNASGAGALIELARSASLSEAPGGLAGRRRTLVFLSTDGGAFGALGAARFVRERLPAGGVVAVVVLDTLAGRPRARLDFAGDGSRSPAPTLVETSAARIAEQTGEHPRRTSALAQLVDLGLPFSLYEQAPFVGRGIPAVTLTTASERPPPSFGDVPGRLRGARLSELGRSAQTLLASLDEGPEFGRRPSSYLYFGGRIVRGWTVELVLVAALLPFLFAAVDLFARCRRRRIALAPALRSYRRRAGFWLWTGAVFAFFALTGVWPDGSARPIAPESAAAGRWPLAGIAALAVFAALGWLVARERLLPRRPVRPEEELAGYTASLLALAGVAVLVAVLNPFALIFVLPSAHAWLWLPQLRDRPAGLRAAVFAAGLAGPLLALGSFARRFELGLDAPWYVAELAALGYFPLAAALLFLAWLAAAGQLAALAGRRYAAYPAPSERPPLGPMRQLVHRLLLAAGVRPRRRFDAGRRALEA